MDLNFFLQRNKHFCSLLTLSLNNAGWNYDYMNAKNIAIGGLIGGIVLFLLLFGLNMIINQIIPYDIAQFGGMRHMDDPIMTLFFIYPFVLAFSAAWAFDSIHTALSGSGITKGISFGIFLLILGAIPSNFAMFTSMDWPVSFYIGNSIWAVFGFLLTGILYSKIWRV
jgi:hypothetical protein